MYIHVKVIAGARRESIEKSSENRFTISVREKAKQNMANNRILELIALEYKIPTTSVRIINGHHTPTKLLSIIVPDRI